MSVRLCCVSVIGLCYILCILQHFYQGGRFFPDTVYKQLQSADFIVPYRIVSVCLQPKTTAKTEDLIQDAIEQQLALCQCPQWYPVQRVDDGVYRVGPYRCCLSRYKSRRFRSLASQETSDAIEIVLNDTFRKIFSTRSQEVVEMCKQIFGCQTPSDVQWQIESANF